jgi:hypothetical protein
MLDMTVDNQKVKKDEYSIYFWSVTSENVRMKTNLPLKWRH